MLGNVVAALDACVLNAAVGVGAWCPPPVYRPYVYCQVVDILIGMYLLAQLHVYLATDVSLAAGRYKVVGVDALYKGSRLRNPFGKSLLVLLGKGAWLVAQLPCHDGGFVLVAAAGDAVCA